MAMTPCDLWTGRVSSEGYGLLPGGNVYAHRDAWERANGPIPAGLTLDHLCRVRLCRNVDHLEPVTRGENVLRGNGFSGRNSRKTECVRGHPYTPESTMVRKNGSRTCRICYRMVDRARRHGEPIPDVQPADHRSVRMTVDRARLCLLSLELAEQLGWSDRLTRRTETTGVIALLAAEVYP